MDKPISIELAESVGNFLGEGGLLFMEAIRDRRGTLNTVLSTQPFRVNDGVRQIPHPVHFREGMAIRNHMRDLKECEGWDDHDFDDNWQDAVLMAVDLFNDLL